MPQPQITPYRKADGWYFGGRDGSEHGPYLSEAEAVQEFERDKETTGGLIK